jgi:hypothetical protein
MHLPPRCRAMRPVARKQRHLHVYLPGTPTERLHLLAMGRQWPIISWLLHDGYRMLYARGIPRIRGSARLPVGDAGHEWR